MRAVWSITKIIASVTGGVVLLVVLNFSLIVVRKPVPFVLRSDLEQLAASGPYNSQSLATEICGAPVDFLGGADTPSAATSLPRARLLSWRLFYPMVGTVSARIVGVGVRNRETKAITGPCEATVTFRYRCAWVDNGRAVVLETQFLDPPKVVRSMSTSRE